MALEQIRVFDPRRTLKTRGFTGRHDNHALRRVETGVSVAGIFQAAEDFAVLGWWSAYDYVNHLRLKHLPKTDLSGMKLEFDIEYDHAIDGATHVDSAKYRSSPKDAMTFRDRRWHTTLARAKRD